MSEATSGGSEGDRLEQQMPVGTAAEELGPELSPLDTTSANEADVLEQNRDVPDVGDQHPSDGPG